MKYVDAVIENNSDNTDCFFTYSCEDANVAVGDLVYVPFARSKTPKKAYVFAVHDSLPADLSGIENLKSVYHIDKDLSLDPASIEVIKWMKRRYFCRYMDAVGCFTPTGKPLKSGKKRELDWGAHEEGPIPDLTKEQAEAVEKISPHVTDGNYKTFLLHGVTGSGKTEVYMRMASKCIEVGKKAIMLVPEISLTPQTIGRFLSRFGKERIAVLHSKLSQGERYDQWMAIKKGEVDIVIGARSAVFAPFENLGAIIIDEEHETTYKSDMTPKYDTLEVAIKRGIQSNAPVILGSATPSVVSNYRAETGIYEKIMLNDRYNNVEMPAVSIVDMREELMSGNKSIFSSELYNRISKSLEEGKQVILFLNRRGYSPFISCRKCGYVMKCPECDISMTYHKADNTVVCHFCGRRNILPDSCPVCRSKYLKHFGAGTEKVEEAVSKLFPDTEIARLDLDTSSKKGSLDRILKNFRKGKTRILIGTQMIAKGLDFDNVDLVGIVAADTSLNIPDFRSGERTFQLVTQVAGRSGRGEARGDVIIQTYMPDNYAILHAAEHDYEGFYRDEILLRKTLEYPPFSDIIRITVLSESEDKAARGAEQVKGSILTAAGEQAAEYILGPNSAPVFKLKDEFRYHIHIKSVNSMRRRYEELLSAIKREINTDKKKGFRVIMEINPFSIY